jgi:hypothetical protein
MKADRRFVRSTIALSMLLSGIAVAPADAAPAAFEIVVSGDATPYAYNNGVIDGTTIQIPVTVTCPSGIRGYLPYAGLPGYFSDGRFAEPYLPPEPPEPADPPKAPEPADPQEPADPEDTKEPPEAQAPPEPKEPTEPATYGGAIDCTGEPQKATTIARSIAHDQDPVTNPFEYFTSGPATVKVTLETNSAIAVSDTKAIKILPPESTQIEILTDTAILRSPNFKENIEVAYRYRCAPAFNGRLGRVSPVVAMANPTFKISCDDEWHSWSGGGIAAHVPEVVFSLDLAGRVATKTIKVTPPLPDAVSSMTLFDATPNSLKVAWTAPRPRSSAAGPVPDTSITGYKIGWVETSTGRTWLTSAPHWPLAASPATLTGLVPITTYEVSVTPVNESGEGVTTRLTGSTTDTPPPPPPLEPPVFVAMPPIVVPIVVLPPAPITPSAPQPRQAAVPRAASNIAISATTRIRRGNLGTLTAYVSTLRGGKYVRTDGLRLVLQRRAGKSWVNLGAFTSKSVRTRRTVTRGIVQFNVRPLSTATYRWVFAGTATFAPSTSRPVTISVVR